jgi:branched-chain amino acid transport system substrate-binding protein
MKPKYFILLFCVMLTAWSCATQTGVTSKSDQFGGGDELFARAEAQFDAGVYSEAILLYDEYVRRYKDQPMAAAALMKIGSIHAANRDYLKARSAYRQIVSDYPSSPFVQDARVEELLTYYQEGRYAEVIQLALDAVQHLNSNLRIFKVYALVGDAYMAMESPLDALDYYARAREYATALEQTAIAEKLKETIAKLDTEDVAILVNHPDSSLPMDFLLYQLGLNYALEEKYDDALKILTEFINRFPGNENRILVESLIDEIKKNAVFNPNMIGVLLPLSGPYQAFGYRALKGIELAMVQFSAQGGNSPINISVKDTGADPDKTRTAVAELFQEQAAAILGPIVTSEVAAREAQKFGIPIITLTQKDNIPEIGDQVFRNFITPKMQVQALASFTIDDLGLDRFAILYPDETYGVTFMNLFWDELLELGGQVVGVESYSPKQTDFTDSIRKLVGIYYPIPDDLKPPPESDEALENDDGTPKADNEARPDDADKAPKEEEPLPIVDFDAIFIPDSPGKAGLIVPQLAYFDIKDVYLLGTNLWHSDSLIKIADQYVQGAVMPDGFFAQSQSPTVQKFVTDFEAAYQESPDFIEAVVYDSALILFQAVSRPHIRYRNDIRDELLNMRGFPGVTGYTRFDEKGEAQKKLHLLRIKGKRFVELN